MTTFSLMHVPVTVTVFGPGGSAATAALKLWPGQLTTTLLASAKTLTPAEAVFVESATEVAVMVTVNKLGGVVAGAV
jgi:hypothetical protein